MTPRIQPFAFFKLQSRAWEFAVGAALALAVGAIAGGRRPARRNHGLAAGLSAWLGVAMIVASAFSYDARTAFPGVAALVPVIGTALVIAGGSLESRFGIDRLVRHRPVQWVGLVSYSLYLWHWPVLIVPELASGGALHAWSRGALVVVTIVLAALSFRFVERPMRETAGLRRRPAAAVAVGVTLTVVAALTATVLGRLPQLSVDSTLPHWPAGVSTVSAPTPTVVGRNLSPSLAAAAADQPLLPKPTCTADFYVTQPVVCVAGDVDSTKTVVLVGDSHAQQWFPAVDAAARADGMRVVTLLKVSCPLLDVESYNARLQRRYSECTAWRSAALRKIGALAPDVILLGSFHGSDLSSLGSSPAAACDRCCDRQST